MANSGRLLIYSNVPIRAKVKAMRVGGIPADISDTAGAFSEAAIEAAIINEKDIDERLISHFQI